MMTADKLNEYIHNPESMNGDSVHDLRALLERYPYFQMARMLYLKNLYLIHDEAFAHELKRAVLYVADRRCLFYFIEEARYAFVAHQEAPEMKTQEPSVDSTLMMIDEFLGDMPTAEKKKQLRYVSDYAAVLEEDADRNTKGSDVVSPDLIPDEPFSLGERTSSQGSKEEIEKRVNESNAPIDDGSFTETLAEIYLKQGRYDKAIEIIDKLSLKFPKKNAYFANRIAEIKLAKQKNSL